MFDLDFLWWFGVVLLLYILVIYFGIGAILCFVASYIWLSTTVRPEIKGGSKFMRVSVAALCGLLGGFVNYGVVTTFW